MSDFLDKIFKVLNGSKQESYNGTKKLIQACNTLFEPQMKNYTRT